MAIVIDKGGREDKRGRRGSTSSPPVGLGGGTATPPPPQSKIDSKFHDKGVYEGYI